MLDKKKIEKAFTVVSILTVLLALTAQQSAWADWGHRDHDWDDHSWGHSRSDHHHYYYHHEHYEPFPFFGRAIFTLPGGYVSLIFGGSRYYYYDGIFYRKHLDGFEVVTPPVGVILRLPPPECSPVIIDGTTYYVGNGIYYLNTPQGYEVVTPPAATVIKTAQSLPTQSIPATNEAFTLNIPNNRGGYTAVILQRSGTGFVGPQGEFYQDFPSVEQLKVMYVK